MFNLHKGGPKISYYDISAVDDFFFNQWDPSTATSMEEMCELKGGLC